VITSAPAQTAPAIEPEAPVVVPTSRPETARRLAALTGVAALAAVAALVLARTTGLWLDEAQSVAIARQPLTALLHALKHDGSPPLYYLLLHFWIRLFGPGDTAVRSMSAVFAVLAVPPAVVAARRTLGVRTGWLASVLLVSTPFFFRYATEARMYSLVILLTALGWVAVERAWRVPAWSNRLGVAVTAGLLALTHYWALFVLAPLAAVIAWRRRWDLLAAVAAGGLLFVWWVPSFLFQMAHTGAPWGAPANVGIFEYSVRGFAGGPGRLGLLGLLYFGLAVLAVVGRPSGDAVVLDLRGDSLGLRLAAATMTPLAIGLAVSALTRSAFAVRYAAIVFLPFALLVAHGVERVRPLRAARYVVAALLVFGVFRSAVEVHAQRTQAPKIAAALNAHAMAGDVVVFCPDQLGPAVTRLLHTPATTLAFPTNTPGTIIDWVDYSARNHAAHPVDYADSVAKSTGTVWLVMQSGYRTFGASCGRIYDELRLQRPGAKRLVRSSGTSYEHAALWRFPARP